MVWTSLYVVSIFVAWFVLYGLFSRIYRCDIDLNEPLIILCLTAIMALICPIVLLGFVVMKTAPNAIERVDSVFDKIKSRWQQEKEQECD